MYLVAAGAVLIVLWWLHGQPAAIRKNGKKLPRPPGTRPLLGNAICFLQPKQKLLDWFAQCAHLGTFEISVPLLPSAIVINHADNLEHVLTNTDLFVRSSFIRTRAWDLFGNGIINVEGELWKIQRKSGIRFLNNTNLKTLLDQVLPRYLGDVEKLLNKAAETKMVVDLQGVLLELTTRLMGEMAYNMDIPSSLPFSKAFEFVSGSITDRFQNPLWKLKESLFGRPLRKAISEVKQFGDTIVAAAVHDRKGRLKSRQTSAEADMPLLENRLIDNLLDQIEDHRIVADSAMNYLSAGRDTTAQSLTWTLYLLMRHPDCLEHILSELQSAFPGNESSLPLTFNFIQQEHLAYTTAVFNESLRLFPPIPLEMKESTNATTFPDGTFLPRGSLVMWSPWAMGRSATIWGNYAARFAPERWFSEPSGGPTNDNPAAVPSRSTERRKIITKSAFEFPVFNGGARSCIGRRMAEMLALSVITDLVWKYRFEEAEAVEEENVRSKLQPPVDRVCQKSLTLPMEGGLPCYVHRRAR